MKTGLTALLAIALLVSFTGMVYAQPSFKDHVTGETFQQKMGKARAQNFEGTVLSHDVRCHCIVLKTAKGSITLQDDYAKFEGEYDRAKGVSVGSKVKGTYKTVDYISYAFEIENIR